MICSVCFHHGRCGPDLLCQGCGEMGYAEPRRGEIDPKTVQRSIGVMRREGASESKIVATLYRGLRRHGLNLVRALDLLDQIDPRLVRGASSDLVRNHVGVER